MKVIFVVAAIIRDEAGRVFATQRGYGDWKDFWEFPGGKIEAGETPEEALIREIREELGAQIAVDSFLIAVEYDYPAFHLHMDCYSCRVTGGELTLKEHEAARWLTEDELDSVDWLPADRAILPLLRHPGKEADGQPGVPGLQEWKDRKNIADRIIGKKILVLGCPGSGKSSFARRLQEKTGLPLVHLDNIWWRPDRTHISREEFDRKLEEILQQPAWILDGDYSRTYEPRIRACDTVIWLDYGEDVCMQGILGRLGEERPDMPWTEQTPDPALIDQVQRYQIETRPTLWTLLEQYAQTRRVIFKTRAEADRWVSGLSEESKDR